MYFVISTDAYSHAESAVINRIHATTVWSMSLCTKSNHILLNIATTKLIRRSRIFWKRLINVSAKGTIKRITLWCKFRPGLSTRCCAILISDVGRLPFATSNCLKYKKQKTYPSLVVVFWRNTAKMEKSNADYVRISFLLGMKTRENSTSPGLFHTRQESI